MTVPVLDNPAVGTALVVVGAILLYLVLATRLYDPRVPKSCLALLPVALLGFFGFIHSINAVEAEAAGASPMMAFAGAGLMLVVAIGVAKAASGVLADWLLNTKGRHERTDRTTSKE